MGDLPEVASQKRESFRDNSASKSSRSHKRTEQTTSILVKYSIFLTVLSLLWLKSENRGPEAIDALIAVAVLTFFFVDMLLTRVQNLISTLLLATMLVPVVYSTGYIEYGNYMSEQGVYGEPTGATIRYCFAVLVLYLSIELVLPARSAYESRFDELEESLRSERLYRFTKFFGSIAFVLSFAVLVLHGVPFVSKVDRFAYWSSLPVAFSRLPYLFSIVAIFVGLSISDRRNKGLPKDWLLICFVPASMLVLLLFSEKFTGLFQILIHLVMGYFLGRFRGRNFNFSVSRLVLASTAAAFFLLGTVVIGYVRFYQYTPIQAVGKLIDRAFGQQGHVWFGIDKLVANGGRASSGFESLIGADAQPIFGMNELMLLVSPQAFVLRMWELNSSFTMGGTAIGLWAFGILGLMIYQIVAGVLIGVVIRFTIFAVRRLSWVGVAFGIYSLRVCVISFIAKDPSEMLDPISVIGLLGLFLWRGWVALTVRGHERGSNVWA